MPVSGYLRQPIHDYLPEGHYLELTSPALLPLIRRHAIAALLEPRHGHRSPSNHPGHYGLIFEDLSAQFPLQLELEDSYLVTDMPACDLCQAVGLVLPFRGLLGRDLPTVASGQRLPHGHNGRFPIALEDDLIATTPGVPPGLQFLVHLFY